MRTRIPRQIHNLARTALDCAVEAEILFQAITARLGSRASIPVIASLTSFPARIHKVSWVIQSLLQQTIQPARIILTLSLEEFPDKRIPSSLRRLESRGLEILWVESNGRSYDKLLPAAMNHPDDLIMTFDDDKIYPPSLLEQIWRAHLSHPLSIIGSRGWEISLDEGTVEYGKGWIRASELSSPARTFLIGGGGILYPPSARSSDMLDNSLATRLAPTADDIWFWGCSLANDTDIRCLGLPAFRPVRGLAETPALKTINVHTNNHQFHSVINHFGLREKLT